MTFTLATTEDIDQLETLINSAFRGEDSKKGWTTEADLLEGKRINAEGIKKVISDPNAVLLKFFIDEEELIGCVYLKKNDHKMYLGMLTVSPTLQAGGVGKQIMKEAEAYAAKNNCDTMEMTVISIRRELIAWYERQGYYNTGKITPFPNDQLSIQLQPLHFITMEKSLT